MFFRSTRPIVTLLGFILVAALALPISTVQGDTPLLGLPYQQNPAASLGSTVGQELAGFKTASGSASVDSDLVAYYSFDDGTATDASGYGNHGSIQGSPEQVPGVRGSAFRFGGWYDQDRIVVPTSDSLSFVDNFTFSLWFNILSNTSEDGWRRASEYGGQTFLAKSGDRTGWTMWSSRSAIDGTWYPSVQNAQFAPGAFNSIKTQEGLGVDLNQWHMLSATHGDGVVRLYLDGILQEEMLASEFNLNTGMSSRPLYIGQELTGSSGGELWYPFNGILDEIRIYHRVLGGNEILNLYQLDAPALSLAGRVKDSEGNPILGVVVTTNSGASATTNGNGGYRVSGLEPGVYTLTPIKGGYSFTPARLTINVLENDAARDFRGIADGDPPTPFLDLPFAYDGTELTFIRALRDTGVSGRVNSWFDHQFPTYGHNSQVLPYDGITRTVLTSSAFGCYNRVCYDGHDGIDFTRVNGQPETKATPIWAAANGVVTAIERNCSKNCCDDIRNCAVGCELGNYVLVTHPNGYFTRYAHMDTITPTVTVGTPVAAGMPLGNMGNTGHSCGQHLHFSVYRGDPRTTNYRQVDPFGWLGDADPWVVSQAYKGPVSSRLWVHNPGAELMCERDLACDMANPAGDVSAVISPGFLAGPARLELSSGLVAQPSAQLRPTGHSFWLRLLEGATSGGPWQALRAPDSTRQTSSAPITLTVAYSDTEILHLDRAALSLRQWDETFSVWEPLTTTVSPINNVITAMASSLGSFDLQAPLLCPADAIEPDDSYFTVRDVITNTTAISRLFDVAADEDWFRLEAALGESFILDTTQLASGVDTVLELYDIDGLTLITADDNDGGGKASHLEWLAPQNGVYFVRVTPTLGSAIGCNATYELSVHRIRHVYLPIVLRK